MLYAFSTVCYVFTSSNPPPSPFSNDPPSAMWQIWIHRACRALHRWLRSNSFTKQPVGWYCWWLKSGVHQLRLVVFPIIYRVSYTFRWLFGISAINSRDPNQWLRDITIRIKSCNYVWLWCNWTIILCDSCEECLRENDLQIHKCKQKQKKQTKNTWSFIALGRNVFNCFANWTTPIYNPNQSEVAWTSQVKWFPLVAP